MGVFESNAGPKEMESRGLMVTAGDCPSRNLPAVLGGIERGYRGEEKDGGKRGRISKEKGPGWPVLGNSRDSATRGKGRRL